MPGIEPRLLGEKQKCYLCAMQPFWSHDFPATGISSNLVFSLFSFIDVFQTFLKFESASKMKKEASAIIYQRS